MKKSFKKAGAAVLSMAMLLSMGAVSMPVYADEVYTNKYEPGQVIVSINGATNSNGATTNKHADDAKHEYDYLTNVNSADVKMYRVAVDGADGWKWVDAIKNAADDGTLLDEVASTAGAIDSLEDFRNLLTYAVANDDFGTSNATLVENTTAGSVPQYTVEQLQSLASKLQRLVASVGLTPVATGKITKDSTTGNYTAAYLPSDEELYDPGNTKNLVGYYLLVTNTNDAGVVVQPVLFTLKNEALGENAALTHAVTKKISLKGNNIKIDKSIEDVATKVDANDDKIKKDADLANSYRDVDGAIAGSKDSATVSKDDIVKFKIDAEVPKYDTNLNPDYINDFIIADYPDKGLDVIGYTDSANAYKTPRDTSGTNLNGRIKVSFKATSTDTPVPLTEGVDYTVQKLVASSGIAQRATVDSTTGQRTTTMENAVDRATGEGFTITFTPEQLRGLSADGSAANTNAALYDPASSTSDTMEGGHIIVEFEATITSDEFQRGYYDNDLEEEKALYTVDDLTLADVAAQHSLYINMAPVKQTEILGRATEAQQTLANSFTTRKDYVADQSATTKVLADKTKKDGTSQLDNADIARMVILALEAKNAAIEAENEAIRARNKAKTDSNGGRNIAEMTYGNDYATGRGDGKQNDVNHLYSVDLDLTKVVIENNVADTNKEVSYVKEIKITTDKTKALKSDNKEILVADADQAIVDKIYAGTATAADKVTRTTNKEDTANAAYHGLLPVYVEEIVTTNDPTEAIGYNATTPASSTYTYLAATPTADGQMTTSDVDKAAGAQLYLKSITFTTDKAEAYTTSGGKYVYKKAGKTYLTTMDVTEAEGYEDATLPPYDDSTNDIYYVKKDTDGKPLVVVTTDESEALEDPTGSKVYILASSTDNTLNTTDATNVKHTGHKDDTKVTKIKGAIFELVRDFTEAAGSGTDATDHSDGGTHSYGVAISDENGKFKMMTKTSMTKAAYDALTDAQKAEYKYVSDTYKVGEDDYVDCYSYDETAEDIGDAWTELSAGTYKLYERVAPAGYKKWAAPVAVTITAEKSGSGTGENFTSKMTGQVTSTSFVDPETGVAAASGKTIDLVFNNKVVDGISIGQLQDQIIDEYDDKLPATGGIGTVLFTAGGISVVLIAGALFVMYMKKKNSEDEE